MIILGLSKGNMALWAQRRNQGGSRESQDTYGFLRSVNIRTKTS